ncbi:MAG: hypothetical protein AAGD05_11895 [Bacteroidota bacterium]
MKGCVQTRQDLQSGRFQSFEPYQTSYGLNLTDLESAIAFNNIHENLHLGTMMALRKLV